MLTELGKSVAKGVADKVNKYIDLIGGELGEKERLIFYKTLSAISKNLEKVCESYDN